MTEVQENIVKFVDAMIGENYKTAHKFLEIVVEKKMKERIKKAAKKKIFKNETKKSENKKASESAFGKGKFPKS